MTTIRVPMSKWMRMQFCHCIEGYKKRKLTSIFAAVVSSGAFSKFPSWFPAFIFSMFSFNLHASTSILRKENVSHTVGEKTNYT